MSEQVNSTRCSSVTLRPSLGGIYTEKAIIFLPSRSNWIAVISVESTGTCVAFILLWA